MAIVLVFVFHAGYFLTYRSFVLPINGVLGVDLFFVLSGFLITTLLLEERERTGRLRLTAFYIRRARRLLPALLVLLFVALVAASVSSLVHHDPNTLGRELRTTLYALAFATNFGLVWDGTSIASGMGHLWSLATEEQFYLLWPFALMSVARFRPSRAAAILTIALIAEVAREVQVYEAGKNISRLGFAPDTRSSGILVGCLLAVGLRTAARDSLIRLAKLGVVPALVGLVWIVGMRHTDRDIFVGGTTVFALLSAIVLARVLDPTSWLGTILSLGPLVYLGRISYSLYLWHFPIFYSARFFYGPTDKRIAGILLSLLVAAASYHLVELPFIRGRKPPVALVPSSAGQGQGRRREGTNPADADENLAEIPHF